MICNQCGKEIRDGVKFCPFCGADPSAAPEMEATRAAVVPPTVAMPQAQPPMTQAQPPMTQAQPPMTQARPPMTQAQPPMTQAQPPYTQAQPPMTQAQPPMTQAQPPMTQAQPPYMQAQYQPPAGMPVQTAVKPKANPAKIVAIVLTVVAVLAAAGFGIWYAQRDKSDKHEKSGSTALSMDDALSLCVEALNRGDAELPATLYPGDDFILAFLKDESDLSESDIQENRSYFLSRTKEGIYAPLGHTYRLDANDRRSIAFDDATINGKTYTYNGKSFHIDDIRAYSYAGSPEVSIEVVQINGEWKILYLETSGTYSSNSYDTYGDYDWNDYNWENNFDWNDNYNWGGYESDDGDSI